MNSEGRLVEFESSGGRITKILPVAKEKETKRNLTFSEQERKLTLTKVIEYLQTADPKNAIEAI